MSTPTAADPIEHIRTDNLLLHEYADQKDGRPYYEITDGRQSLENPEVVRMATKIGGAFVKPEDAVKIYDGEELNLTAVDGAGNPYKVAAFATSVKRSGWLATHSAGHDIGEDGSLRGWRIQHPEWSQTNKLKRVSVYATIGKRSPINLTARDAHLLVHGEKVEKIDADGEKATLGLKAIVPKPYQGTTYFNARIEFVSASERLAPRVSFGPPKAAAPSDEEHAEPGAEESTATTGGVNFRAAAARSPRASARRAAAA